MNTSPPTRPHSKGPRQFCAEPYHAIRRRLRIGRWLLSLALCLCCLASTAAATTRANAIRMSCVDETSFTILKNFDNTTSGGYLGSALIQGADGALYGTAGSGGAHGCGTLFKLNSDGTGFTVLLDFDRPTGAAPTGVIQGMDGGLYGTTTEGGAFGYDTTFATGYGTVFRVNPDGSGHTVLANFDGTTTGDSPFGALLQGSDGALYGTTWEGGGGSLYNSGTVFKLDPDGSGFTVLKVFTGSTDGGLLSAALIQGADGALYGTTRLSGGTVFRLNTDGTGFAVLNTGNTNGDSLLECADGSLVGTSRNGGLGGYIFKLNLDGTGFAILKNLDYEMSGGDPVGGLIEADDGALYGTSSWGGLGGFGTAYKLNPDGSGFTVLQDFDYDTTGGYPYAALLQGTDGNIYGTTVEGGVAGFGTLFRISLNAAPTAVAGMDQSSVARYTTVDLDGSSSFDDNTPVADLAFAWTLVSKPIGSTAALSATNVATPSFVVDLPGTYAVELVVTDAGGLASAADQVLISSDNLAPTADAGSPASGYVGGTVQLDGSASSDPDLDPLGFNWFFTAQPVGSTVVLVGDDTATPQFTPDLQGTYTVGLFVFDGFDVSALVEVSVQVVTGGVFAEEVTADTITTINLLPSTDVTSAGNQKSLTTTLSKAVQSLQDGDLADARRRLQAALERTDGCVLRGSPDTNGKGRDWVTDCAAQEELYLELSLALEAIAP